MAKADGAFKTPGIVNFFLIPGLVIQALCYLYLCLGSSVLGVDISAFNDPDYVPDEPAAILYALVALLALVLLVVNFILLMLWVYRTNKNTHNLPVPDLEYEPGWAVGWWFVPFANLWKPFDMMCELYNANRNPPDWHNLPRPALLWTWWAVSMAIILPSIAIRFVEKSGSAATSPYLALYGLGLVRIILLLVIVLRINAFQKKAYIKPGIEQVF